MVDNLVLIPQSAKLLGTSLTTYQVKFTSNTVDSIPTAATPFSTNRIFEFYNVSKDPLNPELLFSVSTTSKLITRTSLESGQFQTTMNVNLNQLRKFNQVDRIIASPTGGNTVTLNYSNFSFLINTTPNIWGNRTTNSLIANFTPSNQIQQNNATNCSVKTNVSFNDVDLDLYLRKVVCGANEYIFPTATKLSLLNNTFDIPLVLIQDTVVTFEYFFDRNLAATRFFKSVIILDSLLPPTNPPVIIGKKFTIDFVNVTTQDGDTPYFEYSIIPNPTVGEFVNLEVSQQDLFPKIGSPQKRTSTNYMTRKTAGFQTDVNERIRVIFTLRTVKDGNHTSIPYDFKFANDTFSLIETTAQEQQIKSSELYTTKVRDTYIDFLLINDFFNEDFVNSFKINAKEGANSIPFTKINSQQSSQVMINLTGLKANTIYALEIIAVTDDDEFVIQNISVYTTITIPAIPTDTEKEKQAIQQIERMSFDNDLIESIEGLSLMDQKIIVEDAIKKLNDSDQVGIIHNRNVAIRKGGIYTKAESDTVKTNYRKTVEIILKTNSINIPAIDEGYYDSKTEET